VDPLSLLWLFFVLASLQPALQRAVLENRRRLSLQKIARTRKATVITLIHRQETMSFLGFPVVRYIDIDDSESILRAIRDTPAGQPIEIVLHTPGGLVLAARQIASALADHDGHVTAVVPHYAMSGGTLIALAADEIVMESHASLGPVDPQLGQYPAASILAAVEHPQRHSDQTLILADVSRKAITQVESFTRRLLERKLAAEDAAKLARAMAGGAWTHDHPLLPGDLKGMGLPVQVGVGDEERELITLYPQPRGRIPAVEYEPGFPSRREIPRPSRREASRRG
jgi:ClpP class serine protease